MFAVEFQCLPLLAGLVLIPSLLLDLLDFLSNSLPESESDSTNSELLGFFGVFRCFLDEAIDEVVEAGDDEEAEGGGAEVEQDFEDFSSLVDEAFSVGDLTDST